MNTSRILAASFVALFALTSLNGCAETVTASSRVSGGMPVASLSGGKAANTPAPAEARQSDRGGRERTTPTRDARFSRIEVGCPMCRR